jgi:N-(2-amino-2-carboxyethyl)-L-glutamate synthase
MGVITAPDQYHVDDLFVDLRPVLGPSPFLKVEGFNLAGSIKLRPAREMVDAAERAGVLTPRSILVESSSGNLGVALAVIAASRGYEFHCVTDVRGNAGARRFMEALGSRVHVIAEPRRGSLLEARIAYVRALCAADDRCVSLDQYVNADNWRAHYARTAPAVLRQFPDLDVLFVGAGTTGTLMGCARWLAERRPSVRVVAVDSVGSVTFGTPPARRLIPGLGTGVRPPILEESLVDDVVHVAESETLRTCRRMARHGFLFGGSTGTVVGGSLAWLAEHDPGDELTTVALSPDLGERYLDTVYCDTWVTEHYGDLGIGRDLAAVSRE